MVTGLILDPPSGTASVGWTVTATMTVANTGGLGATVNVAYSESNPTMLGGGTPASPLGPFVIAGGASQTVSWTY